MAECANRTKEERDLGMDKALTALKDKIVCETWRMLELLGRGYMPDLEFLFSEICLAGLAGKSGTMPDGSSAQFPVQFYLNNRWLPNVGIRAV